MISFPANLRDSWCSEWRNAIILKLYGQSVGYYHMVNRLTTLWRPSQEVDFVDVGHGFYIAKFQDREDALRVLSGGPYSVAGSYVMLRQWTPQFIPAEASLDILVTWIRIVGLPLEYYNDDGIFAITKKVGAPIRIDRQTSLVSRGKFARVCVELDLSRPLIPEVGVDGKWLQVEYEGIPKICRLCFHAGHDSVDCVLAPEKAEGDVSMTVQEEGPRNASTNKSKAELKETTEWMVVKFQPANKKRKNRKTGNQRKEEHRNRPATVKTPPPGLEAGKVASSPTTPTAAMIVVKANDVAMDAMDTTHGSSPTLEVASVEKVAIDKESEEENFVDTPLSIMKRDEKEKVILSTEPD
ncbi:hypothetical protein LINGRAHAP2_LOCUS6757 [Linum grandiflorum]